MSNRSQYDIEKLRKVFIGGLDRATTNEELQQYFATYGEIVDSVVIKDSQSKQSRGFGFVTYSSSSAVDDLLNARPHTIGQKEVEVKRAVPRDDESSTAHERTKKVFIGGLPKDTKEEEIRAFFEKPELGVIIRQIDMIRDKNTQEFRGFGFMTLENEDMADKLSAIRFFEGKIAAKKWEVKKAEPKGGVGSENGGRGGGRGGGGRGGVGRGQGRGGRGQGGGDRFTGDFNQGGNSYGNGPHGNFYGDYGSYDDYGGGFQQGFPRNEGFSWGSGNSFDGGQNYGRYDDFQPSFTSTRGGQGGGRFRPY